MGKPNWFLTQGLSAERGGIAEGNSFVRVEPPQASGVCVWTQHLPADAREEDWKTGGGRKEGGGGEGGSQGSKARGKEFDGKVLFFSFPCCVVGDLSVWVCVFNVGVRRDTW